jgi:hypothetical protein
MRIRKSALWCAIIISLVALSAAADAAALGRSWQPLIIKGEKLTPLLGAKTDHFEVLALRDGKLAPIPFQVDERLPDGRYALPDGPEPLSDDSPGILDGDDEVAMMISDLGERATEANGVPRGAVEIEMIDPLSGAHRYAYIASVAHPDISPLDYVDYDFASSHIESDHYRLGFTHEVPTDYALQDHKHENGPNLIDRMKVRVSARVLTLFPFRLDEDDIHNRVLAYRDGPVRVIRRMSHSVTLIFGIRSPQVQSDDFFYRDFIENPFHVRFPWVPRVLFGDIKVAVYLDFNDLHKFTLAWSQMNGDGVQIGDAASERQVIDDPPSVQWIAFRGEGRTMVQTIAPNGDLKLIDRRLYYRDDASPDPPESYPGDRPGIGYMMTGWERLSRGYHTFDSLLLSVAGNFDPNEMLQELSTPPIIETRPVAEK